MKRLAALFLFAFALNLSAQSPLTADGLAAFVPAPASGGGPTIIATDDFTRADSSDLGANWTISSSPGIQIRSNKATGTTPATLTAEFWSANVFANNQYCKGTIVRTSSADYSMVGIRMTGNGGTYCAYVFFVSAGTLADETHIYRIDNNVSTSLHADSTHINDGDVIEIRGSGSTIGAYINGSLLYSVTDTTYTSGSAGLEVYNFGTFSHFEGGNL